MPPLSPLPVPNTSEYIYVDQHLSWNTHIAHVIKKGMIWNSHIRRIAAPTWGITPKHVHKMYITVAISKILYAVDIWGTPKNLDSIAEHKKGISTAAAKMISMQRAEALATTGCLCTAPTDLLLDLHGGLLPIHLEIDKQCNRVATRIATLLPAHPLYKPARKLLKCDL